MSQEAIIQILLGLITGLVAAYTRLLVYQIQLEINSVKDSLNMVRKEVDAMQDGIPPAVLEERINTMRDTLVGMNQAIAKLGQELSKRTDDLIHLMEQRKEGRSRGE